MSAWIKTAVQSRLTFPSLTGSIVTFNSQYAGLPLKSHKIALTATQSGSGTPSPSNPRPISGYSAINIGNSIAYDTNIEQGTLDNSGLNANATNRIRTADYIPVVSGHTYKITLIGSGAYYLGVSGYTANDYTTARTQSTAWLGNNTDLLIDSGVKFVRINIRFQTNTAIVPSDISGILITDVSNYTTIQIGSTVYGGTYNAITGILTVTHGYADNFSTSAIGTSGSGIKYCDVSLLGITRNAKSISNIYDWILADSSGVDVSFKTYGGAITFYDNRFTDVATANTILSDTQIVYELASPQTIQLPPCPIDTLLGENNIWADTGDTTLQYPKFG